MTIADGPDERLGIAPGNRNKPLTGEIEVAATKKSSEKKSSARKARDKSVYEKLESSIVGRPIVIANQAFLAGLGLVANVRSDLSGTFTKLAKDGEKVRKQYQSQINDLRDDVVKQAKAAQKRVVKNVKSVAESVAEVSPVATQHDLDKLNSKLDKVLAEVAK